MTTTSTWVICPIVTGELDGSERGNLTLKRHMGEKTTVPCIAWLLRSEHGVVLVDVGAGDPEVVQELTGRRIRTDGTLPELLSNWGLAVDDIDCIVLTHLHFDHVGGLDYLPSPRVFVQRSELEWAIAALPPQDALYEWRSDGHTPRWIRHRHRMTVLDGDYTLFPGLEMIHLPGHTPGSMGVLVETGHGRYLIAGDAVPTYENLRDGVPTGWYVDLKETHATMRKIDQLDAIVLPSHDVAVLSAPGLEHVKSVLTPPTAQAGDTTPEQRFGTAEQHRGERD